MSELNEIQPTYRIPPAKIEQRKKKDDDRISQGDDDRARQDTDDGDDGNKIDEYI